MREGNEEDHGSADVEGGGRDERGKVCESWQPNVDIVWNVQSSGVSD